MEFDATENIFDIEKALILLPPNDDEDGDRDYFEEILDIDLGALLLPRSEDSEECVDESDFSDEDYGTSDSESIDDSLIDYFENALEISSTPSFASHSNSFLTPDSYNSWNNITQKHYKKRPTPNDRPRLQLVTMALKKANKQGLKQLSIKTDSRFIIACAKRLRHKWAKNNWRFSNGREIPMRRAIESFSKELDRGIKVTWNYHAAETKENKKPVKKTN